MPRTKTVAATFILLALALGLGALWAFMPRNVPVNDDRVSANTRLKLKLEKEFPYVSTWRLFTMTIEHDKPLLIMSVGYVEFSEPPLETYPADIVGLCLLKPETQILCLYELDEKFPAIFSIGFPGVLEAPTSEENTYPSPKFLEFDL